MESRDGMVSFEQISAGPEVQRIVGTVMDTDEPITAFMKLHRAFFIFELLMTSVRNTTNDLKRVLWRLVNSSPSLFRLIYTFDYNFELFVTTDNKRDRVGGIIIDCTGEYVLLVRPPNNRCWSPPKSKLTPQDSKELGAHTEILQEVGLDINVSDLTRPVEKYQLNSQGEHFKMTLYFCTACRNINFHPESSLEIGFIMWFKIDTLCSFTLEDAMNFDGFNCDERAWKNLKPFLGEIKAESELRKNSGISHPDCRSTRLCIPVFDHRDAPPRLFI